MTSLWRLDCPEDERFCAKWGPGKNDNLLATDGVIQISHFQRPFQCIVRKHQMGDMIWGGYWTCLISDRLLQILRSEQVTGYEVAPANPRLMFSHEPNEAVFWQLRVTGWGGIASSESGIEPVVDPGRKGDLLYSPARKNAPIIDPQRWDGSDFFIVWPLPMYWWVTAKVVDLLSRHKIKRYRLLSIEELSPELSKPADDDGIGFMPGRLRHFMSDERARAIGEPLGIY